MLVALNIKTNCCENMLITCFASCLEMWKVIWEMRFRFISCLKLFKMICFRDHVWSFHRQFCWSFNLIFWRITHAYSRLLSDVCLFSICRATYAYFRFIERCLWWDVIKLDEAFHQIHCERLIKFDEWRRHFIKSKEDDSSNLTKKTSSYQIKWTRHLIKLLKRKTVFLFSDEQTFAATLDVKNLILRKIFFCVKINVYVNLLW